MTVAELIYRLQALDPKADVLMDMDDDDGRLWPLMAVEPGIYVDASAPVHGGLFFWVRPEEAADMAGLECPQDVEDGGYSHVCLRPGSTPEGGEA